MSLTKASLTDIVKKQYFYKLKAYIAVFSSLVVLQLLAILFSFGGFGLSSTSTDGIQLSVNYYSADMVIVFTMLWAFITSIFVTTKAYRNDDFAFVTNRVSSNLSNSLFLLTSSLVGGITAMLSSFLLKVIVYYLVGIQLVRGHSLFDAPQELLVGIAATILYVLLFSTLGYFVGMLVQLNRIFVVLLPVVFFGTLFLGERSGEGSLVTSVFEFFFTESSFPLFLIKIILTVGLLFSSAIIMSNRMEVRQ